MNKTLMCENFICRESGVDVVLYTLNLMLKLKATVSNMEKQFSDFLQVSLSKNIVLYKFQIKS